jgi:hypothetical protein
VAELVVVLDEVEEAADDDVLVKSLTIVAAVLFRADTFKLTDTEALAAELDDDEVSSAVAVDE